MPRCRRWRATPWLMEHSLPPTDEPANLRVPPLNLARVDVVAFVDTFAQGPFHEPVPVTNWREFQLLFGGFDATSEASYGVYLFFENGGEVAWIVRVPDPAESGLALVGAGGDRQASPRALADSLLGSLQRSTGIHALRTIYRNQPAMLAIPRAAELGPEGVRVYREALQLCQELGMLLAIDPPLLADSPAELRAWLHENPDIREASALLCYPRLLFPDALQHGRNRSLGASGAVAGLLSWLDQERGVWHSPAGLHAVLESVMVSRDLAPEDLSPLLAAGVNPIRDLPGHGTVLWGARTLAGPEDRSAIARHLPIRRLVMAVQRSLRIDLRWTAEVPMTNDLSWQIMDAVEAMLQPLWKQGALHGEEAEDAYSVYCDLLHPESVRYPGREWILKVELSVVQGAEPVVLVEYLPIPAGPEDATFDRR